MKLNVLALVLSFTLLLSCGEDTRKTTHKLYESFTHNMDSLEAVQDQLKREQAEVTTNHLDLTGQFTDMEQADSTALHLLTEHQELLTEQEQLLDSISFTVHKKFTENYSLDVLTDEQILTILDGLRIKNQRISKNLRQIEQELQGIRSDQQKLQTQIQ
ncbi:MAG: hypothetical protein WBG71_09485 [Leeuwenhoekiella sp.]